jgi:ComF family protein
MASSPLPSLHARRSRVERAARFGGTLLDLALPPSCAGCGAEGTVLCPGCGRSLRVRFGLPPGVPLGLPAAVTAPLAQLEWCAPFSGPVRAALHRLKYAGERRLAEPLGQAMAARWSEAGAGGNLLVPVPVHRDRARKRGFDQAFLLAEAASARLRMPWLAALERARTTAPQFELNRRARRRNVRDAFALRASCGNAVAGAWVVLIDDVVTTGSTLAACAESLYEAGASAVSGLTVAHER